MKSMGSICSSHFTLYRAFLSTRSTILGEPPPVSLLSWSRGGLVIALGVIHSRPRRDKRQGMRSIPQGPRRINSKSSDLRGASSLQDTKRQGAGYSPKGLLGLGLGQGRQQLLPQPWYLGHPGTVLIINRPGVAGAVFFWQSGEAYRWRVCYQRGLSRLVHEYMHIAHAHTYYN